MKNNLVDKVIIRQLRVPTLIGVHEEERRAQQVVTLDLELAADFSKAVQTDDIQHALDYAHIRKTIITFLDVAEFSLLETLAERIADLLFRDYGVSWLSLTATKAPFDIKDAEAVGVKIERSR